MTGSAITNLFNISVRFPCRPATTLPWHQCSIPTTTSGANGCWTESWDEPNSATATRDQPRISHNGTAPSICRPRVPHPATPSVWSCSSCLSHRSQNWPASLPSLPSRLPRLPKSARLPSWSTHHNDTPPASDSCGKKNKLHADLLQYVAAHILFLRRQVGKGYFLSCWWYAINLCENNYCVSLSLFIFGKCAYLMQWNTKVLAKVKMRQLIGANTESSRRSRTNSGTLLFRTRLIRKPRYSEIKLNFHFVWPSLGANLVIDETPLFQTIFHVPWDFTIAGCNCSCSTMEIAHFPWDIVEVS